MKTQQEIEAKIEELDAGIKRIDIDKSYEPTVPSFEKLKEVAKEEMQRQKKMLNWVLA